MFKQMAKEEIFDFYSKTNLKSYNIDEHMRYQLNILGNLDVFTRIHSENVANLTCRICEYLNYPKTIYSFFCFTISYSTYRRTIPNYENTYNNWIQYMYERFKITSI